MFLGYNTNGLAHHDLFDAVELLAEIGYRGVAITIDHNALAPGGTAGLPSSADEGSTLLDKPAVPPGNLRRLRRLLEKHNMRSVIETGARYLLNPQVKHEPTLLSDCPRRRIEFYKYAVDCAAELGSDCVSIWSGTLRTGTEVAVGSNLTDHGGSWRQPPWDRLVAGLREVLDYAAAKSVTIAFEPEPGMFIDTMPAFEQLLTRIDAPNLRLTLDIGHLQCQGELPIPDVIRRWAPRLANVHIEDMRRGVHEHLMFGDGEIDFPPILQSLAEIGYQNGIYVELSRHSHEGPSAARRAYEFLARITS
jgi:L-ribulose-5-phosphate 3-epimerase